MSHGEVVGHGTIPCSTCEHPNDPHAEWCEACLTEFEPALRRHRRPKRPAARDNARPAGLRDEVLT